LFALAGSLAESLDSGQTLVVDELESKLHPLVTKEIVKIFNSVKGNKKNAQLIFTTHDTNLLHGKYLRRDQIWFTEKDTFGCSHLYSLAEYKPRKDASFQKDYISGRYGAVPYIGDFEGLIKG
jgi:AAA15 family ATPase/GTPase